MVAPAIAANQPNRAGVTHHENFAQYGNLESWIGVLTAMEELPVQIVAPGHGERAGNELLGQQKRYFVELRAAVKQMISEGLKLDEIKQKIDLPFYRQWTGLDVKTRVENIEHVYQELTSKR